MMVEGFVKELKKNNNPFIRFICYTELSDREAEKRIDKNILISNLIRQLIEMFDLESYKLHRFSADKEELENLLTHVKDKCYVIVDGLDHINRQYDIYIFDDKIFACYLQCIFINSISAGTQF